MSLTCVYHRIAPHYFSQSNQCIRFLPRNLDKKIDSILISLVNCLTHIKIICQGTVPLRVLYGNTFACRISIKHMYNNSDRTVGIHTVIKNFGMLNYFNIAATKTVDTIWTQVSIWIPFHNDQKWSAFCMHAENNTMPKFEQLPRS